MDCDKLDKVLGEYETAYNKVLAVVSEWLEEWLGGADEKPMSAPACLTTVYRETVIVRGVRRAEDAIAFVYERKDGEDDYLLLEEVTAWSLTYFLSQKDLRDACFG